MKNIALLSLAKGFHFKIPNCAIIPYMRGFTKPFKTLYSIGVLDNTRNQNRSVWNIILIGTKNDMKHLKVFKMEI